MAQETVRSIRRAFFAGAIVLTPLAVTVWVFMQLINFLGGPGRRVFERRLPEELFVGNEWLWTVAAALIAVVLITLLGYLSRYVAGKFLLGQAERVMQRVPLIGAVYNTSKQIIETFSVQRRAVFEKVVLIPFPRDGCYVLGFQTNQVRSEASEAVGDDLCHVFVPTTPNPTSGFLVLIPTRDVREMKMTIGEGMKFIVSGGAVIPPWPPPADAAARANDLRTTIVPPAAGDGKPDA